MRTQQRWAGVGLALSVMLGLALAASVLASAEAATNNVLGVGFEEFATGFEQPVGIVFTGVATDTRMFVIERAGVIKVVQDDGTVLATPFLSITDQVDSETFHEMGLLGLAFDPDFANNSQFYIYYDDLNGDLQLSRYEVSPDPNVALTTEVKLLNIPHPINNSHNGGELMFGPDGYLYLAPGDGDNDGNAQAKSVLLGKVLRINVSGVATYTIPASNPFTLTVGARPEIWATGLRNPWRFSFDKLTGEFYLADVGQNDYEEVNRVPADSPGKNYGWRCYEGLHEYFLVDCPISTTLTFPIFEYAHDIGQVVIGGYVYRGSDYPTLRGLYFFTDGGSANFWAINSYNNVVVDLGNALLPGANPSTFGEDPDGELYLADIDSGTIYKLTGPAVVPIQTPLYVPMVHY